MATRLPNASLRSSTLCVTILLIACLSILTHAQLQHSPNDPYIPTAHSKGTWPHTDEEVVHTYNEVVGEPRQNSNKQHNAVTPSDVRALATLAPAGQSHAVRAPPAQSTGPSRGLSSRLPARSLQDWEVEDIVLLATVDGTMHARDRKTGSSRWSLESDRPMVETAYHARDKYLGSTSSPTEDFIWIVEPSQDGSLYGYTPGSPFGVQSLGLTVRQLVELAPYASEDPPVVYTGRKESTLYTVDVNTGHILAVFSSSNATIMDQGKCRRPNSLEALDDEECGATGTLTLGRTEYTVAIQSRSGQPICTIRYFEWGPNLRDRDLYNQYATTKDNRYIYSMHDGRILALDHLPDEGTGGMSFARKPTYKQKLVSPVARVFDVARPVHARSSDAPLVILPQPARPTYEDSIAREEHRVFVNCTEAGSWYALSENAYPMVTVGAQPAQCSRADWLSNIATLESGDNLQLKKALVGYHTLAFKNAFSPDVPLLSGPEETHATKHVGQVTEDVVVTAPPSTRRSQSFAGMIQSQPLAMALLLICLSGYGWRQWTARSRFAVPKTTHAQNLPVVQSSMSTKLAKVAVESVPKVVRFANVDRIPEVATVLHPEPDVEPLAVVEDRSEAETPDHAVMPAVVQNFTRPVNASYDGQVGETDEVSADLNTKRRKAHRGTRGGKREKEKRGRSPLPTEVDSIIESVKQDVLKQDITLKVSSSQGADGHSGLHNLIIHTDDVLGNGSGGTFVFRGTYEGRDVAVKRMLPQFNELVNQEVSLLEQNDEHPNVIRYFCQRQDQHFLYIALELCQASLWDLFRDGHREEAPNDRYTPLINRISLDPEKVLRQLAEGLAHLHRFRIVHRDIKPHNILFAYPKKNNLAGFPRVVISDFGLCKTLPENASTLKGITGNAGTAGWKAPELIFQPKDSTNGNGGSGSQHSTNNSYIEDIPVGAQGVKRAVDIFSMGCVFFYVLSRGKHPFDDIEGWTQLRERNIKTNRADLHAIELLGADIIDLIRWMLSPRPEDRPTANQVLAHPFFWPAEDRLEFLSMASDRFDQEIRDPPSVALLALESRAEKIIPVATYSTSVCHERSASDFSGYQLTLFPESNFLDRLDKKFVDTLGKQRKYNGARLADLLRALRNKHHHWDDMPDDVKARVGQLPEGYLNYWEDRFPGLVVGVWRTVRDLGLEKERRFWRYFGAKEGQDRAGGCA